MSLRAIDYRLGTREDFLDRLREQIAAVSLPDGPWAGQRPLRPLADLDLDDPALALTDAWAAALDVLTFYQERHAQEHYLDTATERRSVRELARLVGQELSPGVAASVFLAFTVEDTEGSPPRVTVPAGTRVQSIPGQDELPQTFETRSELVARAEWNALAPRLSEPPALLGERRLFFAGTATGLARGDRLLLVLGDAAGGVLQTLAATVAEIAVDGVLGRTRVDLAAPLAFDPKWAESGALYPAAVEVWALREQAAVFGHNAPRHGSLPPGTVVKDDPYPESHDWDRGRTVWTDSAGTPHNSGGDPERPALYLDRPLGQVVAGSWALVSGPVLAAGGGTGAPAERAYRLAAVAETTLADYALQGPATALALADEHGAALPAVAARPAFELRGTRVWLAAERLELAELPIEAPYPSLPADLEGRVLVLDRRVEGLGAGQPVALSGIRAEGAEKGVRVGFVGVLQRADTLREPGGERTRLVFQEAITRDKLERDSLRVNANVMVATHGETVEEVLGSGDGEVANQSFRLLRPPLTWLPAPVPGGVRSTLEVRVDGVLWQEVPTLETADSTLRGYELRQGDDGRATVRFGDGIKGARLPSGQENVVARYRSGLGSEGEVAAGSLSLLVTRPLGIREVSNPLPAAGGAPPDDVERGKRTAVLAARTRGRLVSIGDYEAFAHAFAGIAKARLDRVGGAHLSVAGIGGAEVRRGSALYESLVQVLEQRRAPGPPLLVASYERVPLVVVARLVIDPRFLAERVFAAARRALLDAFAFERRDFLQPVFASEVIAVLQSVEGVVAVALDALHPRGAPRARAGRIAALPARWQSGRVAPAQILVLEAADLTLGERTS